MEATFLILFLNVFGGGLFVCFVTYFETFASLPNN
jgi:hypothetical protein